MIGSDGWLCIDGLPKLPHMSWKHLCAAAAIAALLVLVAALLLFPKIDRPTFIRTHDTMGPESSRSIKLSRSDVEPATSRTEVLPQRGLYVAVYFSKRFKSKVLASPKQRSLSL